MLALRAAAQTDSEELSPRRGCSEICELFAHARDVRLRQPKLQRTIGHGCGTHLIEHIEAKISHVQGMHGLFQRARQKRGAVLA